MAKRECVEHFVEGSDAWLAGPLGFFQRRRGMLVAAVVTLITMGVPWWWPDTGRVEFEEDVGRAIAYAIAVAGLLLLGALERTRRRSIRSLAIKACLHDLAHFVRDSYAEHCRLLQAGALPTQVQEAYNFSTFVSGLCERVQNYFSTLTGDREIASAVRLAFPSEADSNQILYKTVARSSRLSATRKNTSEPVAADEGIPGYLIQSHNSTGILIYNDLDAAEKQHAFKSTENERVYPNEVRSLMVAPMNAWADGGKRLIGLLYVVSRKEQAFSAKDIDAMRFVADTVANAVATVVEQEQHHLEFNSLSEGA